MKKIFVIITCLFLIVLFGCANAMEISWINEKTGGPDVELYKIKDCTDVIGNGEFHSSNFGLFDGGSTSGSVNIGGIIFHFKNKDYSYLIDKWELKI